MKLKEIDYDSMTDPLRRELYKSMWSDSNFDTAIKKHLTEVQYPKIHTALIYLMTDLGRLLAKYSALAT